MTLASLALAEGVPQLTLFAVLAFALVSLGFWGSSCASVKARPVWVLLSGILSLLLVAAAVLRPARVNTRGVSVGAKVVVLVDESRRLLLPSEGKTRRELALHAADAVSKHFAGRARRAARVRRGRASPLGRGRCARAHEPERALGRDRLLLAR